jgi:hypothetical protein
MSGYPCRLSRLIFFLLALRVLNAPNAAAQGFRLPEPVDNAKRATLTGNVHPLARREFDQGEAPSDLPMDRMLLVLKRSPEQDAQLHKLLDDQQDKSSPQYRRWLTPEHFGQQFGLADNDLQKVVGWLQGQGFHDISVSKGRTVIEFSGTAARVQSAFGTAIKKFVVNGKSYWANATDPSIPSALLPAVEGVFTLHNFYKKPQVHLTENQFTATGVPGSRPQFTSSTGSHALTPADYYKIYNFNPLGPLTGSIAIVARSNINGQDVSYFHYWMYDQAGSFQTILNGPDPGDLGGGDEAEAVLDTTWAGATAPSAFVNLVISASTATTDGVDLSELYIIDNNWADVMTESFGDCEANFTSTQAAGIASLAQQAAAQGITYLVSSGDSGSAGCDDPNTEATATHGLSVNVLSSTPYNVAVGGTQFNENGHDSTYWNSTNAQGTLESAISYIPEDVWNESCAAGQSGCSIPGIWAGGGGASTFFPKPSWQAGVAGIPTGNVRYVPDVSLTAASHDPYLLCLRGSCVPDSQGNISFYGVSGTSAATPSFAGIMALVAGKALSRLGQPNYVLYRLAAAENFTQCNASTLPASTCVFNDVTVGNNAVPGEPNYGTSSETYLSGKGYDQATGLGSVNVTNLLNQWSTVTFNPTATTFSISPTTAVHGDPLTVSGSVTPNSGTGTPTGVVWLNGGASRGNLVGDSTVDFFNLGSQGTYSGVTHLMPGGFYQVVNAHYAGDGTYAASDSTPGIQITIQPEPTTTTFSILTTDASGNLIPFSSGPYGIPVYYQAKVNWQSGYGVPSNWVNFWDTNGASAGSVWVDSKGNALTPALNQIPVGAHSITAGYYGDNSFNTSVNLTPVNFTITSLATTTSLTSQQTSQSFLLTSTVSAAGIGTPATGTVTFSSGATILGSVLLTPGTTSSGTTQATATFDASQLPAGQYNVTASYPGDANYKASTSAALPLNLAADFSVDSRGITSQMVVAGLTASYINDIEVTPFFGFTSAVTLSCTVPAKATTCSVNPTSYPTANGTGTLTVTTTARSSAATGKPTDLFPFSPLIWFGSILVLFFCAVIAWGEAKTRPSFVRTPVFSLLLLMLIAAVGCGGGGSGSSGGGGNPPPANGTAAGTYTVTVTAVSGTLTHTTTLTLVVQ